MMAEGMALISPAKAEALVIETLKSFHIKLDRKICIETVLQKFGASIETVPYLKSQYGVEAAIRRVRSSNFGGKKFVVVVDRDIADGDVNYYRLTLSEEVGHFVADPNTLLSVRTIEDYLEIHRDPQWAQRERNRESIGRRFLAPRPLLELVTSRVYKETCNELGFDRSTFYGMFNVQCSIDLGMPIEQFCYRLEEAPNDLRERIELSRLERRSLLVPKLYEKENAKSCQLKMNFEESDMTPR